ncbi:MAG TPA: hypothetical protein VK978_02405 [Candidatus Saccharimonadales bacterium]|nr:hypothetical protein [Candidatus Saccharimonadales bacterium]
MQTYVPSAEQIQELIQRANNASVRTYPDPGGYSVAVLTKSGKIFEGVSYKSDTLTLTMHSEATALAHAAIHGEKDIIAITGPNCHICKQLIWEHALHTGIDIQVIIQDKGEVKSVPISRQMPYPWPDENGNH